MTLSGEHDLKTLLRNMNPSLSREEFVFCSVDDAHHLPALAIYREAEGTTLIMERSEADRRRMKSVFPCRRITLNVHSSLDAVGFLSVVVQELSAASISTNVVSAYYHDHLFVASQDAERALAILKAMAAN